MPPQANHGSVAKTAVDHFLNPLPAPGAEISFNMLGEESIAPGALIVYSPPGGSTDNSTQTSGGEEEHPINKKFPRGIPGIPPVPPTDDEDWMWLEELVKLKLAEQKEAGAGKRVMTAVKEIVFDASTTYFQPAKRARRRLKMTTPERETGVDPLSLEMHDDGNLCDCVRTTVYGLDHPKTGAGAEYHYQQVGFRSRGCRLTDEDEGFRVFGGRL